MSGESSVGGSAWLQQQRSASDNAVLMFLRGGRFASSCTHQVSTHAPPFAIARVDLGRKPCGTHAANGLTQTVTLAVGTTRRDHMRTLALVTSFMFAVP